MKLRRYLGSILLLSALPLALACGSEVEGGAGGAGGAGGSGATGGSGGSGGAGGSGGSGGSTVTLTCFNDSVQFPPASKACATDQDCGQILHVIDCCGSLAAVGLHVDDLPAVSMAEQQCGTHALCDCIAQPTVAEDGTSANNDAIQVGCDNAGLCSTYLP